jgi:hypothetical protein
MMEQKQKFEVIYLLLNETIQERKLFQPGNFSRAETIRRSTVFHFVVQLYDGATKRQI